MQRARPRLLGCERHTEPVGDVTATGLCPVGPSRDRIGLAPSQALASYKPSPLGGARRPTKPN
jgi:hypothetical protein